MSCPVDRCEHLDVQHVGRCLVPGCGCEGERKMTEPQYRCFNCKKLEKALELAVKTIKYFKEMGLSGAEEALADIDALIGEKKG